PAAPRRERRQRHCHVGDYYLSTGRPADRPQTVKSMGWRFPWWRWTPPESTILGQRDNARQNGVRASRLTANISGPWSKALARTERASPVRKIDPDAASGQTRQRR